MKRAFLLLFLLSCTYSATDMRYVIDGDTFVLNNGGHVRLIGIDTPEKGDVNYAKAGYELQRLLEGRRLILEMGVEDKDNYGRLLRYVYADGFVNLQLVESGWARSFPYEPNVQYADEFRAAEERARTARLGIWNVDEASYARHTAKCSQLGCENSVAIASKNGEVYYGCYCAGAGRIKEENRLCYATVQDAIADGLRETRRC